MLIPSRQEIAHGLMGTWMLAKRDRGGLHWLDGSVRGFRKSFYAAVLIAPFYALLLWVTGYDAAVDANLNAVFAIEAMAYVGAWLFWPLLALEICERLDPKLDVRRYIVALNWSEIWIMLLRFLIVTLFAFGLLSPGMMVMLELMALMLVLAYRFIIASLTLPVQGPAAAGFALGDFTAGFAWRAATSFAVAPYLTGSGSTFG